MGVPTFYRWLCNRYPRVPRDVVDGYNDRNLDLTDEDAVAFDLLCPNPNGEFDNLYLDMNGIIHPCCHPENMEQPESEEVMLECILDYIDRIFYIVRPRKLIYLAIDGVAPRAKINQQRSRRFKSAALADLEDETYEKLLREYEEKYKDKEFVIRRSKWDSNVITPGTEFMHKLSKRLVKYIEDRVEKFDAWKRIVVIFSDSNVPGEGEHKIMKFIRNQRHTPNYDPNTTHVLHGMDADLIMLGLATHEPKFFILREIVTFFKDEVKKVDSNVLQCSTSENQSVVVQTTGDLTRVERYMKMMRENWKPFQFLQLSVLREYLSHQLKFHMGFDNGNSVDFERCVDDLVLMIFFCGNDFLPNLPSISITGGSIDQMILLYQKLLPSLNDYLSNEGDLNFNTISTFFHYLSKIEDETFKNIHEYKLKAQAQNQNKSTGTDQGEFTEDDAENSVGEDVQEEFKKRYKEEMKKLNVVEDVKLPVDVTLNDSKLWKEAYYREKFHLTGEDELKDFVEKLSLDYIKGICWVLQYYYQGCPSWSWYYPYHYSPFCSDLNFSNLTTLNASNPNNSNLTIKFSLDVPLTPFQQLMGVMPIRSSHCLPEKLRRLMTDPDSPLSEFYPLKFREDPNGKRYKYQWVALLPFIDEEKLLTHVVPVENELSDEEKFRNRTSQNIIFLSPPNRSRFLNDINKAFPVESKDVNKYEYFTTECDKKHKSVILPGARIPPNILTVQDLMEEQRNRGFNCETAKRMILNMLSTKKDPYSKDPYGQVLRDTARDYHQYHNQYNPNTYTQYNAYNQHRTHPYQQQHYTHSYHNQPYNTQQPYHTHSHTQQFRQPNMGYGNQQYDSYSRHRDDRSYDREKRAYQGDRGHRGGTIKRSYNEKYY